MGGCYGGGGIRRNVALLATTIDGTVLTGLFADEYSRQGQSVLRDETIPERCARKVEYPAQKSAITGVTQDLGQGTLTRIDAPVGLNQLHSRQTGFLRYHGGERFPTRILAGKGLDGALRNMGLNPMTCALAQGAFSVVK